MPITVNAETRAELLRFASRIPFDRSDAVAVAAAAVPLLEWAEQADSRSDLKARMAALERQWLNQFGRPAGDAAAFLDRARVIYAFTIAGDRETDDDDAPDQKLRERFRALGDRTQGDS